VSRESHQQFLEQSARCAATRAKRRAGGKALTIRDVRRLKVQTVEPRKRVVFFVLGIVFGGAGVVAWRADIRWLGATLCGVAFVLVLIAIIGRKRTIERVLDGIHAGGDVLNGIIELINL
jgi:hypothetical protein